MSARPTASICCSPPESVSAGWPARSASTREERVDALAGPRAIAGAPLAPARRRRRARGSRARVIGPKSILPSGTSASPSRTRRSGRGAATRAPS